MNSPKDVKRLKAEIASALSLDPVAFVKVIAASNAGMTAITTGLVRGNIAWFTMKDGRKNVSVVPGSEFLP
jgi:hypothetical protein